MHFSTWNWKTFYETFAINVIRTSVQSSKKYIKEYIYYWIHNVELDPSWVIFNHFYRLSLIFFQYTVNLTKIMELNDLTKENILNLSNRKYIKFVSLIIINTNTIYFETEKWIGFDTY